MTLFKSMDTILGAVERLDLHDLVFAGSISHLDGERERERGVVSRIGFGEMRIYKGEMWTMCERGMGVVKWD